MAKKKQTRISPMQSIGLVLLVVVLVLLYHFTPLGDWVDHLINPNQTNITKTVSLEDGEVAVYYLDIGQGDSQLIQLPDGTNILIDAGTPEGSKKISKALKEDYKIKKIDFLIATHPHADHIGGMQTVIRDFEIGKIYMPKVADSQIPTNRTYENMLKAVQSKNLKITQAKGDMILIDNETTRLELIAPNADYYEKLNDYSIVAKLTYGEKSFLFMGDAEKSSEKQLMEGNYALKADVLKVGHHGSVSSTTNPFLELVDPNFAIISCANGNMYGHPHKEIISKLKAANVKIYRTDTQKTILARSNGKEIHFETNIPTIHVTPPE